MSDNSCILIAICMILICLTTCSVSQDWKEVQMHKCTAQADKTSEGGK